MKKSIQSVFLAFVLLTVILSGCAPASTPVPPTLTPLPLPTDIPLPTKTPIPPTATIQAPDKTEGASEGTVTPVGGLVAENQHYKNLEYAFSFDYPAAWKTYSIQDALSAKAIMADNMIIGVTKPGSNYNIRMALTVETGGPDSFSDDEYRSYAQMLDQASPSGMAKFQKISDEIITIGGVRALEYVFKYDPQLGTGLDQIRQISVVWKGNAFTLSCGAPVGEFDAVNNDAFDLIVRSFRFE